MRSNTLLSLSGPTAIGKTKWAIRLAKHYQTEIVSADSRQFYREMPIGTAHPTKEELRQARHHFIGHRSVKEPYSVGDFRKDALELLQELFRQHPIVVMVGGSGLYTDAVTMGLDEFPDVPRELRTQLEGILEKQGIAALQKLLLEKDPEYHRQVDLRNPRRLLRALEVCLSTGKPFSSFRGKRKPPDFFRHIPLGIEAPREIVYERIEARVDQMMSMGLLEEARSLYEHRELQALHTVGYQELFDYMDRRWELETAISEIKKNTRRFAKRQGTWLRRHPDIHWINYQQDPEEVFRSIDERIDHSQ